jgi:hypothetical protein
MTVLEILEVYRSGHEIVEVDVVVEKNMVTEKEDTKQNNAIDPDRPSVDNLQNVDE